MGAISRHFRPSKARLGRCPGPLNFLCPAVSIASLADAAKTKPAAKLVISGYHDASGDPAQNAGLAKQRAMAVRDALKTAGVAEDRIELKKPEQLNAGDAAEARRVEVSVQ